jgi:hypothetical protein
VSSIKRKHHYLWAHFLRGWSHNQCDVYYRTAKGNIASASTKGLAREDEIYRLSPLDDDDVDLMEKWIAICDLDVQPLHRALLWKMVVLSCLLNSLCPERNKAEREALMFNTIENIHTGIENDVRPALDSLRSGNLSVLNDQAVRDNFHSYMGHQFARTKFSRGIWAKIMLNGHGASRERISKNWWLLSLMLGINVGYSIARSLPTKNVVWLRNGTTTPFVTSDNPVINVHPEVLGIREGREAPEHTDFYFPISPTLAYMVNDSDTYGAGVVEASENLVVQLNQNILLRADETIFGSSREIIQTTKRPRGMR